MTEEQISVYLGNQTLKFSKLHLPEAFLHWQAEARLKMFDLLEKQGVGAIKMQLAHLPVLATLGSHLFPINLAARGMGLLPKPEFLKKFTQLFEDTRTNVEGRNWADTLSMRVEVVRSLYSKVDNFDPCMIGGLEIFEGRTAQNLQCNPLASLLYVGEAPRFLSYQFNGVVTFVTSDDPYYLFLRATRKLFAFDPFHVPQIHYPYGYLFHAVAIMNKTPYSRF